MLTKEVAPMRRLPVLSPTALKMVSECTRAFAFRYIDRVQVPEDHFMTVLAEQGTRMHGHLETARKTGAMPPQDDPEARVASAAIGYWPKGVDWEPEVEIEVVRENWVLRGKSDQFGARAGFVGDYKFTGNKKNLPDGVPYWVKDFWPRSMRGVSEDTLIETARGVLLHDPQFVGYGLATGADRVIGQWTYIVKPPKMEGEPKVLPVLLHATREELEIEMRRLDKIAELAILVRMNYTSANDVPHQAATACGGLGLRCKYSDFCNFEKEGTTIMGTKIEELLAQMQGSKTEETPAPKVNPPEGDAADVQATMQEIEETKPEAAKKTRKKKTSKKTTVNEAEDAAEEEEAEGFEAEVTYAEVTAQGLGMTLKTEAGVTVPVGGKVRVTPC